jgi:hypothetical protein
MKDRFAHHFAILPEAQRKIWPQLAAFKDHFVLYGGTALALRIGHRQSVDFDFFSEEPLDHKWIADNLPDTDNTSILQAQSNTYTVLLPVDTDYVREFQKTKFFEIPKAFSDANCHAYMQLAS